MKCQCRLRSSQLRRANIRRYGASKVSTSPPRNKRSSGSLSPSAAIPLAQTATESSAFPDSTIVSTTPAHPVTVEYPGDSIYSPADFRLDDLIPDTMLPLRGVALSFHAKKHTHSEQDWAWVLSELTSGKDAAKLTHALASRRADKPNPLYYAHRTVDMASARLALLSGSGIQDVIATLEARRIGELPAALCSARAREIAHTAARMIASKQIA